MLTMLILSGMSIEAQAKEPTIKETVAFLNKVYSNDAYSSDYRVELSSETTIFTKPIFKHIDECKIDGTWQWKSIWKNNLPTDNFKGKYSLDLVKQKIEVKEKKDYFLITVKDKNGLKTIINTNNKQVSKNIDTAQFWAQVHGKYKEKVKKALDHLSKICNKKYDGTKSDDDPF